MQTTSRTSGPEKRQSNNIMPKLDLTCKITKLDTHCSKAGGFSDVYKCQYASANGVKEVAVKAFRFHFVLSENDRKANKISRMVRRELGIWRRLCHPNIVPFLGIVYDFERDGNISLVSEWMSNGTLEDLFAQHDDQLLLAHRLQLLLDIAEGLSYLHSFPMVHGDLTCTNVLVDRDFNARLSDFGLASMIGDIPDALLYLQMTTTRPGAVRWAAPEHFSINTNAASQRTIKSDIYSFGNVALLTLSGNHPWSEVPLDIGVVLRLHQGNKPGRPSSRPIEDEHWDLIEHCWSTVDGRPEAADVVSSLKIFLDSCSRTQPSQKFLNTLHDSSIESSGTTSLLPIVSKSPEASLVLSGCPGGSISLGPVSPLTVRSPNFRLHPLLNGDASRKDFYFDLAFPSFAPLRYISHGQSTIIPENELRVAAVYPPITRMRITHDDLPRQPIDVKFHYDGYIVPTTEHPITLGDVLHAIYRSLHIHITQQDRARICRSKETAIVRAFARRSQIVSSTAQVDVYEGLKRVDCLQDKRIFEMLVRAHDEDGFYHWRLITLSKREYYLR